MKKLLAISIIATATLIASLQTAKAQYAPCPQYGTGQCPITTIVVNKTVQNPSTKDYVDNLGSNDPKYTAGQTVPFKVTVTNTGTTQLDNVTITDTIPQYTKQAATKGGTTNGNQITINVGTLKPGESKTFDISVQIVADDQLPSDQAVMCDIRNKVDANSSAPTAHDEAAFCIEHKVLGVTKGGMPVFPSPSVKATPKTGPEMLALIGLIPSGLAGFALRRKTKIN